MCVPKASGDTYCQARVLLTPTRFLYILLLSSLVADRQHQRASARALYLVAVCVVSLLLHAALFLSIYIYIIIYSRFELSLSRPSFCFARREKLYAIVSNL